MNRRHACHLVVVVISIIHVIQPLPADFTSSDTQPTQSGGTPGVTEDPRSAGNSPSSSADLSIGSQQEPFTTQGRSNPQVGGPKFPNHNQNSNSPPVVRPDLRVPPPFGPPCRVVLLSNNSVLVDQPCLRPDSNCTVTLPHNIDNPNREIDVFFCTPPPGFLESFLSGGPLFPPQCRVVDKQTNDTRFAADCPLGTSCQLDHMNPNKDLDIFVCIQPIGDTMNRPRPCKVVQKSSNTTLIPTTDCPPDTSCTEVDQRNPDPNVDVYLCAPSPQSTSRSKSSSKQPNENSPISSAVL